MPISASHVTPVLKEPAECDVIERGCFLARVLESGEVDPSGLPDRIMRAEVLLFLLHDKFGLVGVSGLKRPDLHYKDQMFKASKTELDPNEFSVELGWIYVFEKYQGQGFSSQLVESILDRVANRKVFATTRSDNDAMHHILPKHGFQPTGSCYPSKNGTYELQLYVRPPP